MIERRSPAEKSEYKFEKLKISEDYHFRDLSDMTNWNNFKILKKSKNAKNYEELIPTFVDRVIRSKMEVLGIHMGIGKIQTFQPTKNGKIIQLNVRSTLFIVFLNFFRKFSVGIFLLEILLRFFPGFFPKKVMLTPLFVGSGFLYKIRPPKLFFSNDELHIILKFRNLEIGEDSSFYSSCIKALIGITSSDNFLTFKFRNSKVDLKANFANN